MEPWKCDWRLCFKSSWKSQKQWDSQAHRASGKTQKIVGWANKKKGSPQKDCLDILDIKWFVFCLLHAHPCMRCKSGGGCTICWWLHITLLAWGSLWLELLDLWLHSLVKLSKVMIPHAIIYSHAACLCGYLQVDLLQQQEEDDHAMVRVCGQNIEDTSIWKGARGGESFHSMLMRLWAKALREWAFKK